MILSYEAGGALVAIEFDSTVREDHQGVTTVTEHAVEKGANISDHARPELDRITCDVVVSNTPIRSPNTNADGVTGQFRLMELQTSAPLQFPKLLPGVGLLQDVFRDQLRMTTTTQVTVLKFDGEMNRPRSVYNELSLLQKTSTIVNLSTSLREYSNMVIRSISAPRAAHDGSSVTFTLVATEIRFVSSQIVTVKTDPVNTTNRGPKPAKTPEPKEKQSFFDKAGTAIGVLKDQAPNVAKLF